MRAVSGGRRALHARRRAPPGRRDASAADVMPDGRELRRRPAGGARRRRCARRLLPDEPGSTTADGIRAPRPRGSAPAASASHSGQRSPKRRRTALDHRRPQQAQTLVGMRPVYRTNGSNAPTRQLAGQVFTNERCISPRFRRTRPDSGASAVRAGDEAPQLPPAAAARSAPASRARARACRAAGDSTYAMNASTTSRTGPVVARTTYQERCGSPPRGRIVREQPEPELQLDRRPRLQRDTETDPRRLLDRAVGAERQHPRADAVVGEVVLAQDPRARPGLADEPRPSRELLHRDPAALGQRVARRGDEHPLVVHERAADEAAVLRRRAR